jgi:adenylosuccinate lyase
MTCLGASALTALSPLDGRYAAKVAALRPLLSEFGLMHRRVQVEVEWFIALSDAGLRRVQAPVRGLARLLLRGLVCASRGRCVRPSRTSRRPPTTTSRRWSTGSSLALVLNQPELKAAGEFVHFACTSEDINNTSHALMLKAAREQVLLPGTLDKLIARLRELAHALPRCRCSAAPTARPPAPPPWARRSPTWWRACTAGRARIAEVKLLAKMNGAVGNYNAHLSAYPGTDWEAFSRAVVENHRWAWPSTPTPSRSSRTTTWPSCSTRSPAPTPS